MGLLGRALAVSAFLVVVGGSRGLAAQYGATATVERPIPSGSDLDPTASATTIDTADRIRSDESLPSILRESPGARALSLGTLGSYSTLSLRGTGGEHTRVLLDRLPLGFDGEAFDLSTVPVATLDRVEIYRGGAPVLLGSGAIGGVLRLMPRASDDELYGEAGVGYGSFDTRTVRVTGSTGQRPDGLSVTSAAGIDGTAGDFSYQRDLTPLTPGDEREVLRQNGEINRGYGLTHLAADAGGGRLSAVGFGFGSVGGVPGPAVQPTVHTRRDVSRYGGAIGWSRPDSDDAPLALSASAGAIYERNRFTDTYGEIGLGPKATNDGRLGANALVGGELRLSSWASAALVGGYRYERFDPEDALAQSPAAPSQRHAGTIAGEGIFRLRSGRTRVELRPSARLEVAAANLTEIRTLDAGAVTTSTTWAPTFRLGAVAELVRGLALVGSVSSGTRVPTLTELFGDRGYLLGDTMLSPERSYGGDLGVVLRGRWGVFAGHAELRGFAMRIDDLIRYRRTSQYQAVPENIAAARVVGAEAGLSLRFGQHVKLVGALTLMDTEDLDLGRDLPLRPTAAGYVRPELHLGPFGALSSLSFYGDLTAVGDSYADPRNLIVQGGRTRVAFGATAGLAGDRVRIGAVLDDAFDARGQDVLGFPLPGRSIFVDLTLATGARR